MGHRKNQATPFRLPKLILDNLPSELPASPVPERIRKHGHNAVQYAQAVDWLANAGFEEAQQGRTNLYKSSEAELQRNALANLDEVSRWKLDSFALVALQLLLFLNCARLKPNKYATVGLWTTGLSGFHDDSKNRWWSFAVDIFHRVCKNPESLPSFTAQLILPSVCTPAQKRSYFMSCLKHRFDGFAPPPPAYRNPKWRKP